MCFQILWAPKGCFTWSMIHWDPQVAPWPLQWSFSLSAIRVCWCWSSGPGLQWLMRADSGFQEFCELVDVLWRFKWTMVGEISKHYKSGTFPPQGLVVKHVSTPPRWEVRILYYGTRGYLKGSFHNPDKNIFVPYFWKQQVDALMQLKESQEKNFLYSGPSSPPPSIQSLPFPVSPLSSLCQVRVLPGWSFLWYFY